MHNNESVNDTTGKALEMVRKMDLSNRPWDNGWAAPVRVTDVIETHPYIYVDYARTGYPSERGLLEGYPEARNAFRERSQ